MNFLVKPLMSMGMASASACGQLVCSAMTCTGLSGSCDLVCGLKLAPAQPAEGPQQ